MRNFSVSHINFKMCVFYHGKVSAGKKNCFSFINLDGKTFDLAFSIHNLYFWRGKFKFMLTLPLFKGRKTWYQSLYEHRKTSGKLEKSWDWWGKSEFKFFFREFQFFFEFSVFVLNLKFSIRKLNHPKGLKSLMNEKFNFNLWTTFMKSKWQRQDI